MRESQREKIDEIVKFAKKNEDTIGYKTVVDILKNKEDSVTETDMLGTIEEILQYGILINYGDDEGYPAEEIGPDTFIPADVNISQKPINVYNLMERLENGEINLSPDFQRNGNLWSLEKQSQLIESLMLKIPIPAFYFNAADDDRWVVIDGRQRLTAFQNFLVGEGGEKKAFEGLQYLRDFNGFTFDDLPRQYARRIKETPIIAFTVEKGTPDAVVFNIFQRINTGGVILTDQEIRQALYQGAATELIQRLAESKEFLEATQGAISPARMADREYVTRFLAFTELDYKKYYKGNIDNFLIKALRQVNNYDKDQIVRLEKKFKNIMGFCSAIFGKYAFRKYNTNWRRGPVNKAIFEIWAVCFSELTEDELQQIVKRKDEFLTAFGKLLQDSEFNTALKAGDQYSTVRRIDMARNFVREFTC